MSRSNSEGRHVITVVGLCYTLQVPKWNWWQRRHLSDIGFPLKVELGGDVPNLDGYGNLKIWGELIDSTLDLDECFEDYELLLFFEDCPNRNPKLFFFKTFPYSIFRWSIFLLLRLIVQFSYNSGCQKHTSSLEPLNLGFLQILNINKLRN